MKRNEGVNRMKLDDGRSRRKGGELGRIGKNQEEEGGRRKKEVDERREIEKEIGGEKYKKEGN